MFGLKKKQRDLPPMGFVPHTAGWLTDQQLGKEIYLGFRKVGLLSRLEYRGNSTILILWVDDELRRVILRNDTVVYVGRQRVHEDAW